MLETTDFRVDNFGAGPAALPLSVLEKAQLELLNFRGTGMSVMEISHRHKMYEQVQTEAESRLRKLMGLTDAYRVLFLQGGASTQFSMIPMNLLTEDKRASYVLTGSWSEKALSEARPFGDTAIAGTSKDGGYRAIPALEDLSYYPTDAYLHITSNNTIVGTQWRSFPNATDVPLIADMSSDILSRQIDVNDFSLIYAGAQKNLGPSGVTVVIIREDLLERCREDIPTMMRYDIHVKNDSRYNTPPTFGIYMLSLVLEWMEQVGGLREIEQRNQQKANLIYGAIDGSDGFYLGHADLDSRSNMNVTFRLRTPDLEQSFLAQAKSAGFVGLNGHRSVGGCRASIYNAVSEASCERLVNFMTSFAKTNA